MADVEKVDVEKWERKWRESPMLKSSESTSSIRSGAELKEMIEINLTAIQGYLDEIQALLTKLKANPADHETKKHIIDHLLNITLDSGAIGALEWASKQF